MKRERSARQLLGAGLTAALVGIAMCASDLAAVGSWVTLAGLLATLYGLHSFGRTGPDEA